MEEENLDSKICEFISTQPWQTSEEAATLMKEYGTNFEKYCKYLIRAYNQITKKQYTTLADVFGVDNHALLSIIIQNEGQDQNKSRVQAFESGQYVDFLAGPSAATDNLAQQLKTSLQAKYSSMEKELVATYEKKVCNIQAVKLLKAPDYFYAFAMIKDFNMYYGKGDF